MGRELFAGKSEIMRVIMHERAEGADMCMGVFIAFLSVFVRGNLRRRI